VTAIKRLLIVGAGGHAKVVADAAIASRNFELIGFVDDDPLLQGRPILDGLVVLGPTRDLDNWAHELIVVAVGNNADRRRLFTLLSQTGERFATIVHPDASVARETTLGAGSVVFAGVVVNVHAHIGANVILNTAASVDHDSRVGDHAHIAPGAHLAGGCYVGAGTLIGIGAVLLPGRSVGSDVVIGAGAVVVNDLPDRVTAIGVPARAR
jgi:sugar O-acyltransferase (sialic acid O-acetyltransferase NeuD family)